VAVRCRNATGRRSSIVRMAAPIATCNLRFFMCDNSDTDGLKSGRQVAVQCGNATGRRSSRVKMAAPLATCNLRFSCVTTVILMV